jgi:hypothetical protein
MPGKRLGSRNVSVPCIAPGSVVVREKPFGEDPGGAIELNRLLSGLYHEQAIFRVESVQNILGMRLANRVLESISFSSCVWSPWNRRSASASAICATAKSMRYAPFSIEAP